MILFRLLEKNLVDGCQKSFPQLESSTIEAKDLSDEVTNSISRKSEGAENKIKVRQDLYSSNECKGIRGKKQKDKVVMEVDSAENNCSEEQNNFIEDLVPIHCSTTGNAISSEKEGDEIEEKEAEGENKKDEESKKEDSILNTGSPEDKNSKETEKQIKVRKDLFSRTPDIKSKASGNTISKEKKTNEEVEEKVEDENENDGDPKKKEKQKTEVDKELSTQKKDFKSDIGRHKDNNAVNSKIKPSIEKNQNESKDMFEDSETEVEGVDANATARAEVLKTTSGSDGGPTLLRDSSPSPKKKLKTKKALDKLRRQGNRETSSDGSNISDSESSGDEVKKFSKKRNKEMKAEENSKMSKEEYQKLFKSKKLGKEAKVSIQFLESSIKRDLKVCGQVRLLLELHAGDDK